MSMIIENARKFAARVHAGQSYGQRPYGHHLLAVARKVTEWGGNHGQVAAAWLHDTLEDTMLELTMRQRRGVVEREFGTYVEGMVFACTGESTSRDRAFEQQIAKLEDNKDAFLVKAADRWNNMVAVGDDLMFETNENSIARLQKIGATYLKEFPIFIVAASNTLKNPTIEKELRDAADYLKDKMTA